MEKLRTLRAERGMSIRQLEEKSGVGKDAISEIERGKRTPRLSTLMNLAEGLGIDPQILLSEVTHATEFPNRSNGPSLESEGILGRFTAVYVRDGEWWLGYVEELTGANAQERSLQECRSALREATEDVLEANRELNRTEFGERDVVREPLIAL